MHHVIAPRLRALTLAALLLAGGVACSADFKEGEHYKALKPAQPTSVGPGKVEVVEYPGANGIMATLLDNEIHVSLKPLLLERLMRSQGESGQPRA